MSSNPYEYEPGYENAKTAEDKLNQKCYVMKVVQFNALMPANTALTVIDSSRDITDLCYPAPGRIPWYSAKRDRSATPHERFWGG